MKLDFIDKFDFFTGVPDSLLSPLCNYLMCKYGLDPKHHIIAANEGNCAAIASGYYLATGKIPVVYLQNSGEGNIINPVASLMNKKVYGIPCIFIIGWRGEPGVHDEPQHVYQGEVTLKLLEDVGIEYYVIDNNTNANQVENQIKEWQTLLQNGKQVAFVVKKGALEFDNNVSYSNSNVLYREEIIRHVIKISKYDPIVSTTGKASRELFEIREANGQGHGYDFLTVGSMGHSSSIALGVALNKPNKKIWCIDGDGAALMHLGSMAVIGSIKPKNLVHVLINNSAHESVGGMPTVAGDIDLPAIARACGYGHVVSVNDFNSLDRELERIKSIDDLCFIEIKAAIGARSDLGRPTVSARENMIAFITELNK